MPDIMKCLGVISVPKKGKNSLACSSGKFSIFYFPEHWNDQGSIHLYAHFCIEQFSQNFSSLYQMTFSIKGGVWILEIKII